MRRLKRNKHPFEERIEIELLAELVARTDAILRMLGSKRKLLAGVEYSSRCLKIELQGLAAEIERYLEHKRD